MPLYRILQTVRTGVGDVSPSPTSPLAMLFLRPALLLVVLMLGGHGARAQDVPTEDLVFDGYFLGAGVHVLDGGDQVHLVLPFSEAHLPLGSKAAFAYGGHVLWGVTGFFAEWNFTGGIVAEPVLGASVSATAHVGTFFLDNVSITGSLGATLTVPFGRHRALSLEAEVLYRRSDDLVDFVSFQDVEALTLNGVGVGIGIGLRL